MISYKIQQLNDTGLFWSVCQSNNSYMVTLGTYKIVTGIDTNLIMAINKALAELAQSSHIVSEAE